MENYNHELWEEMGDFLTHHAPLCRYAVTRTMFPNQERIFFEDGRSKVSGKDLVEVVYADDNSSMTVVKKDGEFTVPTLSCECVLTTWDEMLDFIESRGNYMSEFTLGGTTKDFHIDYVGDDRLEFRYTNRFNTAEEVSISKESFDKAQLFPATNGEGYTVLRVFYFDGTSDYPTMEDIAFLD